MVSRRKPPKKHIGLMLRTCAGDMSAYGGFVWPESGFVSCHDWDPHPRCGGGLHGCLNGHGNARLLDWSPGAKWLVCEVDMREVVDLSGKVKVPRAWVVHCGDRLSATSYMASRGCTSVIGGTATAGDHGTATAGDGGTATAGYGGAATAGDGGTATAGDHGTATAGYGGELRIRWWDGRRYRCSVFYVGEGGVKPNTPYRCDSGGRIVKVGQ